MAQFLSSMRKLVAAAMLLALVPAARAADPLEGLWRVAADGALLRIVSQPMPARALDIIWEDGPDLSIEPGTIIGYATKSAQAGAYDCTVTFQPGKPKHTPVPSPVKMVIKLNAKANGITFDSYEQKLKLNLRGLLPWWLRRTGVSKVDTRPKGLDGATRVDGKPQYLEL